MQKRPLIHRVFDLILPPFRRRRMKRFDAEFDPRVARHILDLGGMAEIWEYTTSLPKVTLLNLRGLGEPLQGELNEVLADATQTPFTDNSFNLVFSNSVIEHVGDRAAQLRFATEARRLAPELWVQTPARWFPFEPHLLTPFVHYLPPKLQQRVLRYGSVWGLLSRPSQEEVNAMVGELKLLTRAEFGAMFPDCEIRCERFLGLAKSFVAVRHASSR